MSSILALTLWPEWAWAITHLGKDVENRTERFARQRVNRAVAATLTDLLKPVWSRDIAFNVLGVEGRVPRSTGFLRGLCAHSEEK